MQKQGACRFCGTNAFFDSDYHREILDCDCPVCGHYMLTGSFHELLRSKSAEESYRLTCYLFYSKRNNNEGESRVRFFGTKEEFELNNYPGCVHVTLEMVNGWFPNTFNEKINYILLLIADRTKEYGSSADMTREELTSCLFVNRFKSSKILDEQSIATQEYFFVDYLQKNNYLYSVSTPTLTPEGWQRVDELQKHQTNNKEVFVAMSFAENAKPIREAIKAGIANSGFSPEFMDEIIHNQQIVPEMLRLIRECRFLIMDISDPNYGAYFEAGYASGLGKEVIITCSKDRKDKKYETEEEKKYERYLKPHFDIAQKQILVWDDEADLTKKLTEWIKELMTR